jgi:hypothetical protein
MLSSHKIDYKLPDSEMDDIGEKMNTEVTKLNAQMVTLRVEMAAQGEQLRAQGGQLRALQVTVLFDFIRKSKSEALWLLTKRSQLRVKRGTWLSYN